MKTVELVRDRGTGVIVSSQLKKDKTPVPTVSPTVSRVKIGFPKALVYYEHSDLWKSFFEALNCEVIISPDTNKDILDKGCKHCSNETCLPVKVYHGHLQALKDKVDYIFIPRYMSYFKDEYTCPKFCGLPDMALLNLKNSIKVIDITLNVNRGFERTEPGLKNLSNLIGIDYNTVLTEYKRNFKSKLNKVIPLVKGGNRHQAEGDSTQNLHQDFSSPKIAVIGHPYMIFDNYLSMKLLNKLAGKGFDVLTPLDIDIDTKRKKANPFYGREFWSMGYDNLGSAYELAEKENLKGMIYLTPFACGIDSIVVEFIERRLKNHPEINFLKLSIDEHTGEAGFDTRLEAFLDMIGI